MFIDLVCCYCQCVTTIHLEYLIYIRHSKYTHSHVNGSSSSNSKHKNNNNIIILPPFSEQHLYIFRMSSKRSSGESTNSSTLRRKAIRTQHHWKNCTIILAKYSSAIQLKFYWENTMSRNSYIYYTFYA